MGGRDHIPGLALTHGRSRSRTWVLVRRACVAYVRETTSPYRLVGSCVRQIWSEPVRAYAHYRPPLRSRFILEVKKKTN
nr:MAG TPA: hypothetical protein [Caudoviricetes sp.]